MIEFLKFVDELKDSFPVHVEIYYSKIKGWTIKVYKQGCADDYPKSERCGNDAIMADVYDRDMELAFARAHAELKRWMINFLGGY